MGASMWVPVCMLVLTSTVLFRSRWCVVMSVTSIDANCGQVGIRSPHGWVRSTIRTCVLKHAPSTYSFLSVDDDDAGDLLASAADLARSVCPAARHAALPAVYRHADGRLGRRGVTDWRGQSDGEGT